MMSIRSNYFNNFYNLQTAKAEKPEKQPPVDNFHNQSSKTDQDFKMGARQQRWLSNCLPQDQFAPRSPRKIDPWLRACAGCLPIWRHQPNRSIHAAILALTGIIVQGWHRIGIRIGIRISPIRLILKQEIGGKPARDINRLVIGAFYPQA